MGREGSGFGVLGLPFGLKYSDTVWGEDVDYGGGKPTSERGCLIHAEAGQMKKIEFWGGKKSAAPTSHEKGSRA